MTLDPAVYAFARTRLTQEGWTLDSDWMMLAEILQKVIEDFEADLMTQYETDTQ